MDKEDAQRIHAANCLEHVLTYWTGDSTEPAMAVAFARSMTDIPYDADMLTDAAEASKAAGYQSGRSAVERLIGMCGYYLLTGKHGEVPALCRMVARRANGDSLEAWDAEREWQDAQATVR